MAKFIFMLTKDDRTVSDCLDVYDDVRATELEWIGFKDVGVPVGTLHELATRIHNDGRSVALEMVSTDPDAEVRSAQAGLAIGVDMLMGGTQVDRVLRILAGSNIGYFPFPGHIVGHPSVLRGSIEQIVASATTLVARPGVTGLDLLAYRWDGDVPELITQVVTASTAPVVVAGSIASAERINVVTELGAAAFTIGGAVFDRILVPGGTIRDQITWILRTAAEIRPRRAFAETSLTLPASPEKVRPDVSQ